MYNFFIKLADTFENIFSFQDGSILNAINTILVSYGVNNIYVSKFLYCVVILFTIYILFRLISIIIGTLKKVFNFILGG